MRLSDPSRRSAKRFCTLHIVFAKPRKRAATGRRRPENGGSGLHVVEDARKTAEACCASLKTPAKPRKRAALGPRRPENRERVLHFVEDVCKTGGVFFSGRPLPENRERVQPVPDQLDKSPDSKPSLKTVPRKKSITPCRKSSVKGGLCEPSGMVQSSTELPAAHPSA